MENEEKIKLFEKYSKSILEHGMIDNELYGKYEVKRGLRDISGKGVLVGLTEISEIVSYVIEDGDLVPCEGKLYYRGINIEKLVDGFLKEKRFGFEETVFCLCLVICPIGLNLTNLQILLKTTVFCQVILSAILS